MKALGLRARLLLLLGVAVLPAVALLLIGRAAEQRATTREAHAQVMSLARLTGQGHAQRIEVARRLLIALATHPDIQKADPDGCTRLVQSLRAQYEGSYAAIGRATADGSVDCLALEGATPGLSIADREYFQRAKATGAFVAGDFMQSKVRREPSLAFALPLRDDTGSITHVIFANIDLVTISSELESNSGLGDTVISLLDRQGAIIARSAEAARFYGVKAPAEHLQAMHKRGEMVTVSPGPDGLRRVFAIVAIRDRTGTIVAFATAGVPESTLAARVDPTGRSDWLTIALLALGLFLVTWGGSELLIRRPIARLVKATEGLAQGELSVRAVQIGGARELQTLASALNQMAGKLQERELHLREGQRLEAVGQLAGGIAHDFNNLLTVIIGYADALKDSVPSGSIEAGQLEELRAASARAAQLTHQLLAFSRRQVLLPTPLQLNDVARDMVSLLRRTTGGDIAIEIDAEPALGLVYADRVQMEQVLLNLVINARDAMPFGGRLLIATRNLDDAGTSLIELSVSDNGQGMDDATRSRIFEPFFTTKGAQGTGLGLATVYGIIKQSGGEITCTSEVGSGATFFVRLPRHAGPPPTPEVTLPHPAGGSETILLVDDDDAVRGLIAMVLRRRGYRVRATGSPREALRWLVEEGAAVDLLLTDVRMPEMSGAAFARAARQHAPALKIILMSGDAAPTFADQEQLEGATFEQKPVTPAVILRAVRTRLDE